MANDVDRGEADPRDRMPDPDAYAITGTFRDRRSATDAVNGLSENSVPADSIDVFILDRDGTPTRRVDVEDESGVLRGALIGAACGAILGLLIVIFAVAGVFDVRWRPFQADTVLRALQVIMMTSIASVPVGAVIGLGYWHGRRKISEEEARGGSIMVVVTTEELSEVARRVLQDAGATNVSEGRGAAPVRG